MAAFDYKLNVTDPFTAMGQGAQVGYGMLQMRNAQEDRALAQEAAAKKAEQDAQFASVLQGVAKAPSAEGYRTLMTLRPDLSEGFKRAADSLGEEGKAKSIGFGWQALSAIDSGSGDIFNGLMDTQAEAARNSGNEQLAASYDQAKELYATNPEAARTIVASGLAAIDKDFTNNYSKLRGMPAEIKKGQAEADKLRVEADNIAVDKELEQELAGWNIDKVKQEVRYKPQELALRRQEAETAARNAGLKGDQLRLELARLDREFGRDAKEYKAEAENNFNLASETEDLLLRLTDPKNRGDLEMALGATGTVVPSWTAAGAIKTDMERLAGLLTKDNMRAISGPGVMTDGDRAFALSVVSGLKAGGNQAQQIARLIKLRDKFAGEDKDSRLSSKVANKYGMPKNTEIPVPQTKAAFDALPSGAIYVDPDDGKQYRKR